MDDGESDKPPSGTPPPAASIERSEIGVELAQKQRELQQAARAAGQPDAASGGFAVLQASYSGPLPPPEMLRQYGELDLSFPREIIGAWKQETKQRHKLELLQAQQIERDGDNEWELRRLGVRSGFRIGIAGLIAAVALGIYSHPITAGFVGGIDLVALVTVFVAGSRRSVEP